MIERVATTVGYALLFAMSCTDVVAYAAVFLIGAILGLIIALVGAYRVCGKSGERTDSAELGADWISKKSILLAALPFAITLGVLPYVIRIEKFILASELGYDEVLCSTSLNWLWWLAACSSSDASCIASCPRSFSEGFLVVQSAP